MSRQVGNALPCIVSGLASRAIGEWGWHARLDVGLHPALAAAAKRASGNRGRGSLHKLSQALGAEVAIYLLVPLLVGHSYSLWTDFMVIDCLVLLFVGGLLFPFVATSFESRRIVGPLALRVVKA